MSQDILAHDFFCGAGGSSTGLKAAGMIIRGAANHWALAIETHNTNHPETDHYLDDLQQTHPSRYPYADVAWFSPECTNHSLSKGRKRKNIAQLDLWGENRVDPAEERSRATMREVVEFTAYHRYQVVIVENVVDIRHWHHFETWLSEMHNLGYVSKILYLNARFFGVPQSRDRFYAVFWRKGNRAPNLDFRPAALCDDHGWVNAVQSWKKSPQWGRWGARGQYLYRCPHCSKEVTPPHVPAASVIDWSISFETIGSRKKPLAPRTMERIRAGLEKFGYLKAKDGFIVETGGVWQRQPFLTAQHDGRNPLRGVDEPLWAITGMNNEQQLVAPPSFIVDMKNSYSPDGTYILPPRRLEEPLTTIVASAQQHALITPTPFITELRNHADSRGIEQPLSTVVASGNHHGLVQPYIFDFKKGEGMKAVDHPLSTLTTIESHTLLSPEDVIDACGFRMLTPEELKLGMSFPKSYIILGNQRNKVRQVGNAVCCSVAEWIGRRVVESLTG